MGLEEEIYRALVLGTRDYMSKNGFKKVTLGLSGGVDSSLVATIAADALGKETVIGVSMPSRYSSPGSVDDARNWRRPGYKDAFTAYRRGV
jgi:NAD+ synthase (glutamine-hydrolysing)